MPPSVGLNHRPADRRDKRLAQRGSTAIEFAFVIIPLIWMVCYIIEAGLVLTAQYELQNAVFDASRKIRTGTSLTQAAFKAAVCQRVVLIRNCAANIRIDVKNQPTTTVGGVPTPGTFAGLKTAMKDPLTVGPANAGGSYTETFQPGAANTPGAVIVTYDWPFVVPLLGTAFSNLPTNRSVRRLYGVSVYKNENYS